MDYQEFVTPELLILIPVLYLIGIALKKSSVADRWIPLILGICAIALSALWVFATNDVYTGKAFAIALFTAITQGILVAGASVYANQIFLQAKKKE